ncbi:hypothetical protein FRACA_1460005 [Frankia canadensis]|uniref:Uncharacterized protein n=1 Tax=Frankia canadensis TaxID=1836972 RepID=A0A2I2KLM6_9ACTN|nr:hypothetical protein FRACA_1460005 [Frankia canadensis]SOU53858.1 hypothetical protein FRACA_1460005 [Frankia canadensis]
MGDAWAPVPHVRHRGILGTAESTPILDEDQ